MNDITALTLIAKIKKQTESYDTVVLREDETKTLVEALEARDKQIAELEQRNNRLSEWGGKIEKLLKSTEESLIYSVDMVRELESRTVTVKLTDVNEYLADVHDKTLALTFRRLAEGVRAGDIAEMTAAGVQVIEGDAS